MSPARNDSPTSSLRLTLRRSTARPLQRDGPAFPLFYAQIEMSIEQANGGASAFNGPFLKLSVNASSIRAPMKTKLWLGVAAIGITSAFTAPARAGVSFDIHIGFPPLPRVVIAPPPVCAPPVVVVRPPVRYCEPPPVVQCAPPPVVYCPPPPMVVYPPRYVPQGHSRYYGHVDHHYYGGHHGRR
jgi:hypothetical protein